MKALGIYDQDYHKKYTHYIEMGWLKEYLNAVKLDMYAGLFRLKEELHRAKLMAERFPTPDKFKIIGINGKIIE